MNEKQNLGYGYQVGGSLPPDTPTYIPRHADRELYESLKIGDFCYILTSRQTGKSSLQLRTMRQLKAEGIVCSVIDLSAITEQDDTPERWYWGVIHTIVKSLNLLNSVEFRTWRSEHKFLSPVQCFSEFIEQVLLTKVCQNVVIFIDEIDSVLSLQFPIDDFFALIRACYNNRAHKPEYRRLTFSISGVATPADLIQDKNRTPFNIGRLIQLHGFQFNEALPLAKGLEEVCDNPHAVLREVLVWTDGQPFLTQKLCQLVLTSPYIGSDTEAESVEQLVRQRLIETWEAQDVPQHLRTIRDRILRDERRAGRLLGLYQQILQQEEVAANDSLEQVELQLSGLVVKQSAGEQHTKVVLRVYNPIYASVFNLSWVEGELAKLRPYAKAIAAWLRSDQDESRLLRGQALYDALEWAENKSLSDRDYHFLTASQELDKEEALDAEIKAKEILSKAQQRAQQIIKKGWIVVFGLSALATAFLWIAITTLEEQRWLRLEREAFIALRQFESTEGEVDALLMAMKAGQDLKVLVGDNRSLENYPTVSPIFALQRILDQIHKSNELKGHQGEVWTVSFSPDGKLLATGGEDGTVRLWNGSSTPMTELKGHQGDVFSVNFSPDGEFLVTAGENGSVILWSKAGNLIDKLEGHQGSVLSSSFSPDEKYLATAEEDSTVILWERSGKSFSKFTEFKIQQGSVQQVSFVSSDETAGIVEESKQRNSTPDKQQIMTAGANGIIEFWDLSGKPLSQFNTVHLQSESPVYFVSNLSPDGEKIVTAGGDGIVRLWHRSGEKLFKFNTEQGTVFDVSFSPDGKYIATAGIDGTVKFWDLYGELFDQFKAYKGQINRVIFKPLLSEILNLDTDEFPSPGYQVALVGAEGTVQIGYLRNRQVSQPSLQDLPIYIGIEPFSLVSFSPDGQQIVTADRDGTVGFWNVQGKPIIEAFDTRQDELDTRQDKFELTSVSFSPAGQYIATADKDGTVKLWTISGEPLAEEFKTEQGELTSVSFSPDGQYIATAGESSKIQIWNQSGKLQKEFNSPQIRVRSINFSSDGQLLATAGEDGTVSVLVVSGKQSGQLLAQFQAHETDILTISFVSFSEREYIATAGADNVIRFWSVEELELDRLLDKGCNWLEDYLSTHPEAKKELDVCYSDD